jgi:hypothetical protein
MHKPDEAWPSNSWLDKNNGAKWHETLLAMPSPFNHPALRWMGFVTVSDLFFTDAANMQDISMMANSLSTRGLSYP